MTIMSRILGLCADRFRSIWVGVLSRGLVSADAFPLGSALSTCLPILTFRFFFFITLFWLLQHNINSVGKLGESNYVFTGVSSVVKCTHKSYLKKVLC